MESYLTLPLEERAAYEAKFSDLRDPEFLSTWVKSPSYFATPAGETEVRTIAYAFAKIQRNYSRIVGIGRSLTFLQTYWEARRLTRFPNTTPFTDFPYSVGTQTTLTPNERAALRRHLEEAQISPQSILASQKKILFADFVFSGDSQSLLLTEILLWAKEEGSEEQVKEKIHFFGLYSPEVMLGDRLNGDMLKSAKETGKSFKPVDGAVLEDYFKDWDLPKYKFEKCAGAVFSKRISRDLYTYAGNLAPNAQPSFTKDLWDRGGFPDKTAEFFQRQNEKPFLELGYLIHLGSRQSCRGRAIELATGI